MFNAEDWLFLLQVFSLNHCRCYKRRSDVAGGEQVLGFGSLVVRTAQILSEDGLRHSCNLIYTELSEYWPAEEGKWKGRGSIW